MNLKGILEKYFSTECKECKEECKNLQASLTTVAHSLRAELENCTRGCMSRSKSLSIKMERLLERIKDLEHKLNKSQENKGTE